MNQQAERVDLSALVKVDLHRHVEGAIRPTTAVELGRSLGVFDSSMTVETFVKQAVIDEPVDLFEALDRFDLLRAPVRGYDAVARIAEEAVVDAADDGVQWIDLRFSPATLSRSAEIATADVFRAIHEGSRRAIASWPHVSVELVVIISRRRGVDAAWQVVREVEATAGELIDGADFAADEIRHRTAEFTEVARALDSLGLPLTVHTGEGIDASAVAEALALPGVRRLGHALSLATDRSLVEQVVERQITVEVCPTSNVRSKTVAAYARHPARALLDAGVRLAICTDDPALFGIDLTHELEVAREHLGFTDEEIVQSQQWGQEAFFGPRRSGGD